jgi:hypothetical protein
MSHERPFRILVVQVNGGPAARQNRVFETESHLDRVFLYLDNLRHIRWTLLSRANSFPFARLIRRDARATSARQISIESSTGSKPFGSADSSGFEFGEMVAIKKFISFNVVTPTLPEVSGQHLDRRITDDSTRPGSFLCI